MFSILWFRLLLFRNDLRVCISVRKKELVSPCSHASLAAGDELLPAVDVVGRASESRVGHYVYSERGDVGRFDDTPDGKRGAKLIAAVFEFIAEERCRQRCVDEAGGDEIDSDGRELERQVGCEGGERSGYCRRDPEADAWAAAACAAHEQQRASRSHLVGGIAGNLEYQQEVRVEGAARLREVHVDEAPVVRPASCHHHVVDRGRQVTEEPLERSRIRGVEGRGAQRVELARHALEALGVPAGEDELGSLSACPSGRFESDASATADHDDGLPAEFRFALDGIGGGCGAHDSYVRPVGENTFGLEASLR